LVQQIKRFSINFFGNLKLLQITKGTSTTPTFTYNTMVGDDDDVSINTSHVLDDTPSSVPTEHYSSKRKANVTEQLDEAMNYKNDTGTGDSNSNPRRNPNNPNPKTADQRKMAPSSATPKKITQIQFGILSPAEMSRLSEFRVTSRELFTMPSRKPSPLGCLDPRLGVSDKLSFCETCGRKIIDCAGHFGYIKLALPVFHIGFFKHTLTILQCICKSCSRILLTEEEVSQKRNDENTRATAKLTLFTSIIHARRRSMSSFCAT